MKAVLKFNLDDLEDEKAHLRCVRAKDMSMAIWNVVHNNKHLTDAQIVEKMYYEFNVFNIEELID